MIVVDYGKLYEIFNEVESRILLLTNNLIELGISIPTFYKKIWIEKDIPYIQEIQRIETGIDNLGKYYYYPSFFITSKIWLETGTEIKAFSDIDIKRWINNLNIVEKIIGDSSTIWNSSKTEINWNEVSNEEWM